MVELVAFEVGVVMVVADPAACDAIPGDRHALRLAPDEAMVLSEPGSLPTVLASVADAVAALDPHAVVLDATDGWSVWGLRGDEVDAAFARLSALEPPRDGFVQGEVAGVPAKVVATPGGVDMLVPSMLGAYLRDAVLRRCRGIGIEEASP